MGVERMTHTLNFAVCDDEAIFTEKFKKELRRLLEKNNRPYNISSFNDGTDLIEHFENQVIDAIFLDIDMPNMTGFEVAEKLQQIKKDVIIIFITSHEDKVYQSWEFQPFWFIRKSHMEDLNIVLSRLIVKIDAELEQERQIVDLITDNKTIELNINNILYIQSFSHYIILKYANAQEEQIRCKIAEAEQQLSQYYFVRIQNSAIVNCRFISKITSRSVILYNREEISISRNRLEDVKNEFQRYMRSR